MSYFNEDVNIIDVLLDNNAEIENLIDKAIDDMIKDMKNEYKCSTDDRKIKIEFTLKKFSKNQIAISKKITPVPAAYDRIKKEEKEDVATGQMSLDVNAESIESKSAGDESTEGMNKYSSVEENVSECPEMPDSDDEENLA